MENRTPEWSEKWDAIHSSYMLTWHSDLQGAVNVLADTWRTNIWSAISVVEVRKGETFELMKDGSFVGLRGLIR